MGESGYQSVWFCSKHHDSDGGFICPGCQAKHIAELEAEVESIKQVLADEEEENRTLSASIGKLIRERDDARADVERLREGARRGGAALKSLESCYIKAVADMEQAKRRVEELESLTWGKR